MSKIADRVVPSSLSWVLSHPANDAYDAYPRSCVAYERSFQGAGGIGGLVSATFYLTNRTWTCFPVFDGRGNLMALVEATDGSLAAEYGYGPFGELLRATGPLATLNPLTFSTKFRDWETGAYYYGIRYLKDERLRGQTIV